MGTSPAAPAHASPAELAAASFAAIQRRDADGVVALGAPGYVEDFVAIGVFRGEEIADYFRALFAATPDFELTVDRIVADESTAVVQWRLDGTFAGGPFIGIEATGGRVSLRGVDIIEVSDGQITRNTIYFDGMSFARQIGLLPADASLGDRALKLAFNTVTRVRRHLPF